MRICRFDDNRMGIVDGDVVRDVSDALRDWASYSYPLPASDMLITNLAELRPVLEAAAGSAPELALSEVTLRAPIANPGKILAAPVNYQKHVDEANEDPSIHFNQQIRQIRDIGLFLKANSSMIGSGETIPLRHLDRRNDHEIELVAVIGKRADRVSRDTALEHVAGYSLGLDMTLRGVEERSLRKSIDGFSVVGPWMITADEVPDPLNLDLVLSVNGEIRQRANTSEMVLSLPELIEMASSYYTLHPGDLLFTGTPEGVGSVVPGDVIHATIAGIGEMHVRVGTA